MGLRIIDSARKHGVNDADIIYVIEHAIEVIELEDEPQKRSSILALIGLCGRWKWLPW
jgi:hypothetical protein